MEQILNLLDLTPEERRAFLAAAPGLPQRFAPGGRDPDTGAPLGPDSFAWATVILGNPPPAALRAASRLRWLHTRSAGTDPYTAPGVLPEGALLTSSTGAYGHSVSEHLLAMALALMKRLPAYRDQQGQGLWQDLGEARTLLDAQVLVVGAGDLGSSFARLCRACGARTAGVRRDPSRPAQGVERMYGMEDLDRLLPQADLVALTLPHAPETAGLFGRERLSLLREDAILLNGGRGSVVDCAALAQLLEEGRLWGAGLDVTDPEPLPPDHPLWRQPRALITPHAAGGYHLSDTPRRIARIALARLERYLASGSPL